MFAPGEAFLSGQIKIPDKQSIIASNNTLISNLLNKIVIESWRPTHLIGHAKQY
jgi:hypothetical protein